MGFQMGFQMWFQMGFNDIAIYELSENVVSYPKPNGFADH